MRSLVTSISLYACETWTFTVELRRRIQATLLWCYRKLLRTSYKDHVTSEEVRAKIQQSKTILQSKGKGVKRQGRQRKRWEENTRERTGLEFAKSQRAVENREQWRKLVDKSFVVPKRPLRLRGWWVRVNMRSCIKNKKTNKNKKTRTQKNNNNRSFAILACIFFFFRWTQAIKTDVISHFPWNS